MNRNFCQKCDLNPPPCLITKSKIKNELITLLYDNSLAVHQDIFVCPVNAQEHKDRTLIITNDCIDCGMCMNLCTYNTKTNLFKLGVNGEKIYNSLPHLRLFFESQYKKIKFYNEVTSKGHSRYKRIDILGVSEESVLFIKVIGNNAKDGFYIRSYVEIINESMQAINNREVKIVLLNNKFSNSEKIEKINNIPIYKLSLDNMKEII